MMSYWEWGLKMNRQAFLRKEQFIESKINKLTQSLSRSVQKILQEYYPAEGEILDTKKETELREKLRVVTGKYITELNRLIILGIRMAHQEALYAEYEQVKKHLGGN